ncbi:MAG: ATP-binding protein [Oscillibacter sp.]|nr:ATP-binding protein [Oscillibacter sp.]
MAYDGKVMRRALQAFEEDRRTREEREARRREDIFRRAPRLREIERELSAAMGRLVTVTFRRGTDPAEEVARLRVENLRLQRERRDLLERLGLPEDCLEERPSCPLCGDTGYRDGGVCRCLRGYYAREQQRELSRMLDLGGQSFDTFSLEWYSDRVEPGERRSARSHMEERVYNSCAEFAHRFGRRFENLLFFGAPGLGKTHLSAAIAREVSGAGWSVVYDTAGHVFRVFEDEKFSREEAGEDVERVLRCDLLILDDLGTELTTAFVQSALYEIVNTRLVERRSTILSTNLMPNELGRRYSPQIASRIEGEYQLLPFVGEDIRRLKRERQGPLF